MHVLWDPCITVHCAKSLQSCLTLCNPMDCSPPGSSVHGILQAKLLEGIAIPPPGDLPDLGIKPASLTCPALADRFFTTSVAWEATPCIIMGPQNSCNETVLILHFFSCGHSWQQQALLLSHFFFLPMEKSHHMNTRGTRGN